MGQFYIAEVRWSIRLIRHDFAFKWSYAEMAPINRRTSATTGPLDKTAKCIRELVALIRPETNGDVRNLFETWSATRFTPPPLTITCKPGDSLDHIEDSSVDVVVMDPPYYDNVMYAELSDFFYVWLKRTAGTRLSRVVSTSPDRQRQRSGCQPGEISRAEGRPGTRRTRLSGKDGCDLRRMPPDTEA